MFRKKITNNAIHITVYLISKAVIGVAVINIIGDIACGISFLP